MTHGFGGNKKDKKKHGLMRDKDYISEAYLQGGKALSAPQNTGEGPHLLLQGF